MSFQTQYAVMRIGMKVWASYRFESLIHLFTAPISLVIYYFLWNSIFAYMGVEIVRGFTLQMMIDYYVIGMIVGVVTWSEVDKWMENDLLYGRAIGSLLKPVSFMTWYMNFEAGINIMNILWQMVPVFIIGFVFFGLGLAPAFAFIAFIISIILAFFIYFGMTYLLGLCCFWLKKITGLRRVRRVLFGFLGGSFLPLTLFPEWVQTVLHYLPFEYTRFVPIMIYLDTYTVSGTIRALGMQVMWIIGIYTLIHFVWKRAYRRFTSVGL